MKKNIFAVLALLLLAQTVRASTNYVENFATDPMDHGWSIFGDTNLFHWNSANQNLEVTWDSSKTNSYFHFPLNTVMTKADDFSLSFDIQLTDVTTATGMQLAAGFFNLGDATNSAFLRGTGFDSPNLFEFDYFPDFLSIDGTLIDQSNHFGFFYDNQQLVIGTTYRVVLTHLAGTSTVVGEVFTNGVLYTSLTQSYLDSSGLGDFRLDTFSISSFNDTGAYGSSILASGIIDNISLIVPPPPKPASTNYLENFANDPTDRGWRTFGETNLFHWNETNQNLEVTWDSSKTNSYFHFPLRTVLTKADDFDLAFDIQLSDVTTATGMQIAAGFFNFGNATNAEFLRGTGFNSPNLFEFDYFPDFSSIDGTLIDRGSHYGFFYDNQPLVPGTTYRIVLSHVAGTTSVNGQVFTNGALYTDLTQSYIDTSGIDDFRLDTFSISSFNDTGAYGSAILAHGIIDNISLNVPVPPVQTVSGSLVGNQWQAQFNSLVGWNYLLEGTSDFQNWTPASVVTAGTGGNLVLTATNSTAGAQFFRVTAQRPD